MAQSVRDFDSAVLLLLKRLLQCFERVRGRYILELTQNPSEDQRRPPSAGGFELVNLISFDAPSLSQPPLKVIM